MLVNDFYPILDFENSISSSKANKATPLHFLIMFCLFVFLTKFCKLLPPPKKKESSMDSPACLVIMRMIT